MKFLFSVLIFAISISSHSFELDGIKFDDKIKIENSELLLNGVGIRKATIFKVKVYYGGLYLEQKSSDANAIIASNTSKQIVMNFVHDVDAKKLRSGFSEAFENANKNFETLKPLLEKFNSTISDVVKGDKIIISFKADGVVVNVKGKIFEKIGNAEFSRALLSIWFIRPADEGLSAGLLGSKN
jgi:hypothetical protein